MTRHVGKGFLCPVHTRMAMDSGTTRAWINHSIRYYQKLPSLISCWPICRRRRRRRRRLPVSQWDFDSFKKTFSQTSSRSVGFAVRMVSVHFCCPHLHERWWSNYLRILLHTWTISQYLVMQFANNKPMPWWHSLAQIFDFVSAHFSVPCISSSNPEIWTTFAHTAFPLGFPTLFRPLASTAPLGSRCLE